MTLAYERQGHGTPLVLLHGLGHRWQGWSPVLSRLAESHDVIAVDMPGFGRSAPTAGPRWREDLAPAVAEFFTDLNLDRPHVAGNSLGGALALELAIAGKVSSATALCPAGFWTPWERRRTVVKLHAVRATTFLPEPMLRTMLSSSRIRAMAFAMFGRHPGRLSPEAAFDDALAMRNGSMFRAVARHGRGYAVNGNPQCPITIAWSTQDRILPYHQSARARQRFPEAHHVDLPDCGHVPMNDNPELVASIILHTTNGGGRP